MSEGESIISAILPMTPWRRFQRWECFSLQVKGEVHMMTFMDGTYLASLNSWFGRYENCGDCAHGYQCGPCLIGSSYHICWLPSCELQHVVVTCPCWNVRRFKTCIFSRKLAMEVRCSP